MLTNYIYKDLIIMNQSFKDKEELFRFASQKAYKKGFIDDEDLFYKGLVDREAQGSTELKPGIAIPHAKIETVKEIFVILFFLKDPVKFKSGFGKGVTSVFLIGAPPNDQKYMSVLGTVARIIEKDENIEAFHQANVVDDIIYQVKKSSIAQQDVTNNKPKSMLILSLNVKFSTKKLNTIFLELGVSQPIMYQGDNISIKNNFGFSTFGMSSFIDYKGTLTDNKTYIGITDDAAAASKLYSILKDDDVDVNEPGVGTIMSVKLDNYFGGIDVDFDF